MKFNTELHTIRKLQILYDQEINASIEWFWDGGIEWSLGDEVNGFKDHGTAENIEEAINQLWNCALCYYKGVNPEFHKELIRQWEKALLI